MKPNDGLRLQLWYAGLFQKAKSVLRRCVHAFFQSIGSIYSLENRFRRLTCISFLAMVPTDPMELLAFRTVSDQSDLTTSSPVNLLLSFCSASTVWCWSPFGRVFFACWITDISILRAFSTSQDCTYWTFLAKRLLDALGADLVLNCLQSVYVTRSQFSLPHM